MNSSKKPINQHSLQSLELWLTDLGAVKDSNNLSKWYLLLSNWNATIIFEQEDLSVKWESEGQETKRLFSYCINSCLLYTSPSPRDLSTSRMPSSA